MPGQRDLVRRLGPAGLLGVAWAVLPILGLGVLAWNLGSVTRLLAEHRGAGIAAYIGVFAVCAGLALLPTWAQSLIGGWAFGFAAGGPAAVAAIVVASLIGFEAARGASSDRVEKVIAERPAWKAVRDALLCAGFFRAVGIVALIRLPPNSPFAITNLVLASAGVPRRAYVLGTALGIAPRTLVTVFLGSQIRELTVERLKEGPPKWLIGASVVLALVAVAVIGSIAKKAVERVARRDAGGA